MPSIDPTQMHNQEEGEFDIPPVPEKPKEESKEELEEPKEPTEELEPTEEPFKVFKTQEELDAYIEAEREKFAIPPDIDKKSEDVTRIFDPNWKPLDWNDFAISLLENPTARQMLIKEMSGEVMGELKNMTQAEKEEMEKINKGYDEEYDTIAKQGLLPALNTEEGKKVDKQISLIGATYGIASIAKSYDLWKKIPIAQGGGLEYVPPKKASLNLQKQRAGLVQSPSGTQPPQGKVRTYEDFHKKSMDDLMDEVT